MSRYNFRPNLTDHAHLQILLRPFFNASEQDFNFVQKKLAGFNRAELRDSERNILLAFNKRYHRDSFNWGALQFHRRPLGFIGIARLSSDPVLQAKEYEKLETRFTNLVAQYESLIFDSRCIVIGPVDVSITMDKKNIIYIPETEEAVSEQFISFISDFVTSVFVVLESKRFDKMNEDCERMQLPTTQHEPEQHVSESDTRFLKKKCFGRNRKLIGDLCLLAGLYKEALVHYYISLKSLRNVNDYLWIGGALEGLCACSVLSKLQNKPELERRKSSLSIDITALQIDKPNISANVPVDREMVVEEERGNTFLTMEETVDKYRECLACYRKFDDTGLILLEGYFKLIRIFLREKRKLEVSELVQDLLMLTCTRVSLGDMESIEFLLMLSSIHDQLGMKRKAAFFRQQVALLYLKNNQSSKPVLSQSLSLFNQVLPIYKLDLSERTDVIFTPPPNMGWKTVQSRVLLGMLIASERLRNKLEVVRLLFLVLSEYSSLISPHDHDYLMNLLEQYSDSGEQLTNESHPDLVTKLVQPLPIIRDFVPKKLAHYLQPIKIQTQPASASPFIYSNLTTRKDKTKEKIVWVCDDVCEVAMVVDNPLPAEIKVNEMMLITEGTDFEAHPATLALPAQSGSFPFMLLGTPLKPGNLIIKGYKVEILCITSIVYLPQPITVEVTPRLPILRLSSTLPRVGNANGFEEENMQTLFTSSNLYHGRSCNGKLMLQNSGNVPITNLDVEVKHPKEKKIIFNGELVQSALPLPPGETLNIDVEIMPEEAWKFVTNKDSLEVSLTIKYSCEDGTPVEYNREIMWVTYVKVMPSLQLSNFQFHEIERHPTCATISCDTINMTTMMMTVASQVRLSDQEEICQTCSKERLFLLASKKNERLEFHFPRLLLPAPTEWRKTIEDSYRSLLCDSLHLRWRLADTNCSGVAYVPNINITPDVLAVLKPKDIMITMTLNQLQLRDGQTINSVEGEMIDICIELTNTREENVDNIVLAVNPFQECRRTAKDMKQLCLPSGCLYKGIQTLCAGETVQHKCGLMFLYYGKFIVDVSCHINENLNENPELQSSSDSGFPIPIRTVSMSSQSPLRRSSTLSPRHKSPLLCKQKPSRPSFWEQTFIINVKSSSDE